MPDSLITTKGQDATDEAARAIRVTQVDAAGAPAASEAAARLAADNLALPTAPDVLALEMVYDQVGDNVDRARAAVNGTTALTAGVRASGLYALDAAAQASQVPVEAYASNGDAKSQNYRGLVVASRPEGFNPVTLQWDRLRANAEGTLLASAARTTTTNSTDQTNINGSARLRVFINVTAFAASPSVVFTIQAKDPISGVYTALLTSVAIVGTGHTILELWPGATAAANVAVNGWVGRTWRLTATHGNADSITYSVGYQLNN